MGVLENRKEYFLLLWVYCSIKVRKSGVYALWKVTTMLRKIYVRFIETFFRYQLVLKLLEWVFHSVYN